MNEDKEDEERRRRIRGGKWKRGQRFRNRNEGNPTGSLCGGHVEGEGEGCMQ